MIDRAHIIWWQLSFFESSSYGIENRIGQHTSLVDQGTVDSFVDHVLEFTKIGFKSDLPRRRQCFLLDYFADIVDTEGLQTLLLVILRSFCNSLLPLLIFDPMAPAKYRCNRAIVGAIARYGISFVFVANWCNIPWCNRLSHQLSLTDARGLLLHRPAVSSCVG